MTDPTIRLLAATFKRIGQIEEHSLPRESVARTLDAIAGALEVGLPPDEIAVTARAAARAARDPKHANDAEADAAEEILKLQSRRAGSS